MANISIVHCNSLKSIEDSTSFVNPRLCIVLDSVCIKMHLGYMPEDDRSKDIMIRYPDVFLKDIKPDSIEKGVEWLVKKALALGKK